MFKKAYYKYMVMYYSIVERRLLADYRHAAKIQRYAIAHNAPGSHGWELSHRTHVAMCQHKYAECMLNKYKSLLL